LLPHDRLRYAPAHAPGQSALRLPSDAYLDVCVAAVYPLGPRRIADDFPTLAQALGTPPADAGALFALAEALRQDPLGAKAAQGELALDCVRTGLATLDPQQQPEAWATGLLTLGNMLLTRIRGERAENLEQAIRAYEQALTVRTRDAFPADWASTQNNLGTAYRNRIRGERAENLEQAIRAFEQALTVRTRDAFP